MRALAAIRRLANALTVVAAATQLAGIDEALAWWYAERRLDARWRCIAAEAGGRGAASAWWRRRLNVRGYTERLTGRDAATHDAAPDRARYQGGCGFGPTRAGKCKCGQICEVQPSCNAKVACWRCAARHFGALQRKMIRAMAHWASVERSQWLRNGGKRGQEKRASLLTLTREHSGNLEHDRRELSAAWHRFHAWYVFNHGPLRYAWTHEITPGADGRGHVHLHVCAFFPYVKWRRFHDEWRRATRGAARVLDVRQHKRCSPKRAAAYMAKYASKGVFGLPAPLAAQWIRAAHKRRGVSTSRGWWIREDGCVHSRLGAIVKKNRHGKLQALLSTCTERAFPVDIGTWLTPPPRTLNPRSPPLL